MIAQDFITAPAVVVGGGIAGLSTALSLRGCLLAANEPIGGGASKLAQGGIAAALDGNDSRPFTPRIPCASPPASRIPTSLLS